MLLAPLKLIGRCIWRGNDDTQTANAESQHSDPKGGTNNGVNQHGLQTQQAHGTTGLYMEHQVRKFCQVHALNATLGKHAVRPCSPNHAEVLRRACKRQHSPRSKPEAWCRMVLKGWKLWRHDDRCFPAFSQRTKHKAIPSGPKHSSGLKCRHVSEGLTSRSECLCAQVALRQYAT